MNTLRMLHYFNFVMATIFVVFYFYQIGYLLLGLWKRHTKETDVSHALHRYAAVISARNEANVIGGLIASLKAQDYPSELLDIYVIADNCTDNTAQVALEAGAKVYRLLPEEQIIEAAKKAKAAGAVRFSIVTSGRNQDNPNEFEEIIAIVKRIRKEVGIEVCCSLGLISSAQALRLKEAGITRIHCNIETSPSYFPDICTNNTLADTEDIISKAKKAGIRICSGGILGIS